MSSESQSTKPNLVHPQIVPINTARAHLFWEYCVFRLFGLFQNAWTASKCWNGCEERETREKPCLCTVGVGWITVEVKDLGEIMGIKNNITDK